MTLFNNNKKVIRYTPKLNKKIAIYAKADVDDGLGGATVAAVKACDVWAAIWPVTAKEIRENMRESVTVTHTIRTRYKANLTNAMKVVFGSREFEIKGMVNPDESNCYTDFVCEEKIT